MARPAPLLVEVVIEALDPPPNPAGDHDLVFGIQRNKEVEQLTISATTQFEVEIGLVVNDGAIDFRGPYVHGPRGDRFLYVVWGARSPGEDFERFARAKLMLGDIPAELLPTAPEIAAANEAANEAADADGRRAGNPLVCTMEATNEKGHPASGTLREPAVRWG